MASIREQRLAAQIKQRQAIGKKAGGEGGKRAGKLGGQISGAAIGGTAGAGTGALAGGVAGLAAGGVGAIPGAAAGAVRGGQIGAKGGARIGGAAGGFTGKQAGKGVGSAIANRANKNDRNRLAHAKASGNNAKNKIHKAAQLAGAKNRHDKSLKNKVRNLRGRAFGLGTAAIGGILIPGAGAILGVVGNWLGRSVVGKWILIAFLGLLMVLFIITLVSVIGGLMVICEDKFGWALWTGSFVSDNAANAYEVCDMFRQE